MLAQADTKDDAERMCTAGQLARHTGTALPSSGYPEARDCGVSAHPAHSTVGHPQKCQGGLAAGERQRRSADFKSLSKSVASQNRFGSI